MIEGKTVLAIIPARGGSKGVPRKNIRDLCGKPLIAWTIEEAKKSKYIDRLVLSSEDAEIIHVTKLWGCEVPFVRPKELAQDNTSGIEPVLHMINTLKEQYDYVVLLQPTSPLRKVEHIDKCLEFINSRNAFSCVSVTEVTESPFWMYKIDNSFELKPVIASEKVYDRRQDLPKVYVLNGAIYIAECKWLKKTKDFCSKDTIGYIMPKDNSIDIDSDIDFELCTLLKKR